jgi:hypothetical protein
MTSTVDYLNRQAGHHQQPQKGHGHLSGHLDDPGQLRSLVGYLRTQDGKRRGEDNSAARKRLQGERAEAVTE